MAQSTWHNEHKEQIRVTRRLRRARIGAFVHEQKVGKVCVRCGESATHLLHFHHVDQDAKRFVVSRRDCSEETILAEIAKCNVLCEHCHGVLHYRMRICDPATGRFVKLSE